MVIVNAAGDQRFNFLDWEASRPEEGGGLTINIVAIVNEMAGALARITGKSPGGDGDSRFCESF